MKRKRKSPRPGKRETLEVAPGKYLTGTVRDVVLTQGRPHVELIEDSGKVHRFVPAAIISRVPTPAEREKLAAAATEPGVILTEPLDVAIISSAEAETEPTAAQP